jgi:hypothetical protein
MNRSNDITFNLMQVSLPFPSASGGLHRYDVPENIGNSTWNTYYQWLNNIKEMKAAAIKAADPNYQAIAMTLNAWIYANLTDCFGDVPMEEAVRGDEGILRPKFDSQKDIYNRLLADLDSANKLYLTTKTMAFGTDLLYGNNVSRWKKFTNSLRMRLLLRVSNKAEMNAWATLRSMIDNPSVYPVFASNDEAAIIKLNGVAPFTSPWGRAIDFTTFRAAAKFFIDSLNATTDPRLPRWATTARNNANVTIGYAGIPSGYSGPDNQFGITPSNLNIALVTAPMINVVMSYAEVEFIRAEVEFNEGNHAAAKAAYEKGVKASVEQWGAVLPANYFTDADAAYNNTLSRIMMQKYYALFFNDYQQWFEYRRTGLPQLPVSSGMINGGKMPSRFRYPIPVRTNNAEHYAKAVTAQGADDINTKVWWER